MITDIRRLCSGLHKWRQQVDGAGKQDEKSLGFSGIIDYPTEKTAAF
jgi:hypothetical protein